MLHRLYPHHQPPPPLQPPPLPSHPISQTPTSKATTKTLHPNFNPLALPSFPPIQPFSSAVSSFACGLTLLVFLVMCPIYTRTIIPLAAFVFPFLGVEHWRIGWLNCGRMYGEKRLREE